MYRRLSWLKDRSDEHVRKGLSAFAIILREIYKAEQDSSNGFVNVTSALAAMQMQDFSHRRAQRSVGPSDIAETHENAVMVDIETSRHEDDAEKPVSLPIPG